MSYAASAMMSASAHAMSVGRGRDFDTEFKDWWKQAVRKVFSHSSTWVSWGPRVSTEEKVLYRSDLSWALKEERKGAVEAKEEDPGHAERSRLERASFREVPAIHWSRNQRTNVVGRRSPEAGGDSMDLVKWTWTLSWTLWKSLGRF